MTHLEERIDQFLTEMRARKVRKVLRKKGCKEIRQKGSHLRVSCPPDDRKSTIPVHKGKDIKKGTLGSIEKDLNIDIDGDGKPKGAL